MKLRSDSSGELSGFLDEGTAVQGELEFKDTLRIDGKFKGVIRAGRLLVIGESAEVDAEIDVDTITVSGGLKGSVRARTRVELLQTARCECSFDTQIFVVAEGAQFDGSCSMQAGRQNRPASVSDNVKQFGTSK